mmetsp:Transcript_25064/g.36973  ORF Transcript_25064/g.36973 Transcript_25064/m.36973 type:complete len:263 (+) Transcript_25064:160-948(+)|eukprot:CAMPEP_0185030000 /NCGR_PEP_ID=MMETSP1103-20130426/16709_1 /TAXON_ID=36769 /ORGANISM="Paraphysomonas bandaiensis, Strain Caron Lab Isolate" /LENGTH=262 /DNA_ID=CAMNT_0027564959 /DNA_START=103 /DNA_END=891 /DNA_ORIENTATION=+
MTNQITIEYVLKIVAITIVAVWACAGATRLLYPAIWKWIVERLTEVWNILICPCKTAYGILYPPTTNIDVVGLKQHYILPMSFPNSNGERDTFTKSFSVKPRKSEGSLKSVKRRKERLLSQSGSVNSSADAVTRGRTGTIGTARRKRRVNGRGAHGTAPNNRAKQARKQRGSNFEYTFASDLPHDSDVPRTDGSPRISNLQFDMINPLTPDASPHGSIDHNGDVNSFFADDTDVELGAGSSSRTNGRPGTIDSVHESDILEL